MSKNTLYENPYIIKGDMYKIYNDKAYRRNLRVLKKMFMVRMLCNN